MVSVLFFGFVLAASLAIGFGVKHLDFSETRTREKISKKNLKNQKNLQSNLKNYKPKILNFPSAAYLPHLLSMPKVSVVIPTFNRFKYLINTLRSVQEQTYPNIEIIIVNDCSTQTDYYTYPWSKEKNVRIFHLEQNSKQLLGFGCAARSRNYGIDVSLGEYIAFCDDDDIWLPEKIEYQMKTLQYVNSLPQYLKNKCLMACTDGYIGNGPFQLPLNAPMSTINKKYKKYNAEFYFNEINEIFRKKNCSNVFSKGFPDIFDHDFLSIHNSIITSSVLIKKNLLEKINKFNIVKNGEEDFDCWIRALQHSDCVYLKNDFLFYYDKGHGDGQNY
jgi:glycosyltransferase involved in cell wall biosynthesis